MSGESDNLLDSNNKDRTNSAIAEEANNDSFAANSELNWKIMFMEFISTLLFVFVGCAASVSSSILTYNMTTAGRYVAVSLAHGLVRLAARSAPSHCLMYAAHQSLVACML